MAATHAQVPVSVPSSSSRSPGERFREAELAAIAERLEPAVLDWYQTHVLGADSAHRPPGDLVSSVLIVSPDAAPGAASYDPDTHAITIGADAMARFRHFDDGVPYLLGHELGHAVQRTAVERAGATGEGRDAPFTGQASRFIEATRPAGRVRRRSRGFSAALCRGLIDAIVVDDPRLDETAQLKQMVPVPAVSSEPDASKQSTAPTSPEHSHATRRSKPGRATAPLADNPRSSSMISTARNPCWRATSASSY